MDDLYDPDPLAQTTLRPRRGRGAPTNPVGRFESMDLEIEQTDDDLPVQETELFRDSTRSIIAWNDSPDLNFDASVNPYRGCEHGCAYCYARPTHEYLGLSAGLDFESKLFVKENAPELLEKTFSSRSWKPQDVMMSGVTDCYQPIERHLKLTRRCLEVFAEFRNPVGIVTKNELVTRDIDILQTMSSPDVAAVHMSVTSLDPALANKLEPRASSPRRRIKAIEALSRAGVRTGVVIGPVIPGLNDHEISDILQASADAGARSAGYITLRLPHGVKELFADWLEAHYPNRKDRVLNRVRDTRDGELYDGKYGLRMRGAGEYADQIERMFEIRKRKAELTQKLPPLSTGHFRVPRKQLSLF
ncbi:MAG: radical SAM protein [Gemmatimonadetes bacterium]|nr:radical SAM protein [Gemmatimonadota bacterium]